MPEPLVLLHGLGANREAFQRFVRILPDEWDTYPLDLLGHGEAPKPATGYSLEEHANYIDGVLADLGLAADRRPHVLGHSLGAAVAVALAANYPGSCRSLVLLDPPRGTEDATLTMVEAKATGRIAEAVNEHFPELSEPPRRWTISTWEQMAPGAARELDATWEPLAPRVTIPVTVIHGEQALGATGAGAAGRFTVAASVRVDGAGHYLHATHAREVAAAVVGAVERAGSVASW